MILKVQKHAELRWRRTRKDQNHERKLNRRVSVPSAVLTSDLWPTRTISGFIKDPYLATLVSMTTVTAQPGRPDPDFSLTLSWDSENCSQTFGPNVLDLGGNRKTEVEAEMREKNLERKTPVCCDLWRWREKQPSCRSRFWEQETQINMETNKK